MSRLYRSRTLGTSRLSVVDLRKQRMRQQLAQSIKDMDAFSPRRSYKIYTGLSHLICFRGHTRRDRSTLADFHDIDAPAQSPLTGDGLRLCVSIDCVYRLNLTRARCSLAFPIQILNVLHTHLISSGCSIAFIAAPSRKKSTPLWPVGELLWTPKLGNCKSGEWSIARQRRNSTVTWRPKA